MEIKTFVDYYEVMHSERNASDEELKRSYQRLALLFHPDKVGFGLEDKFRLLQKAWSVLRDPASRKQYDAELACYENDQLLLYNTISLSEMEYDECENVYTYQCRCNGVYYLDASEISLKKVNINCDECSFSIEVIISR